MNPEVYASGLIINGFTPNPSKKRETESLCQAIKQFKVSVVIVIDYEKLEKDIVLGVKDSNLKIIKVPKSPGIQSHLHSSSRARCIRLTRTTSEASTTIFI